MKLKCPVCDSVIRFDKTDTKIRCQLCESVFKKDKILAIYKSKSLIRSSKEIQRTVAGPSQDTPADRAAPSDQNAPSTKAALTHKKVFTENINVGTGDSTKESSDSSSAEINEITSATVIQKAKRTKKNLYVILSFCLIAIVLVVAIIWAVQRNQTQPAMASNADESVATETSEGNERVDSEADREPTNNSSDAVSTRAGEIPLPPPPREPFAELDSPAKGSNSFSKPTNLFKAKKMMDNGWFNLKPYLLELYADTPTGRKTATGMIVDSRGWVVTSYNAFKGASEIHLRRAVDVDRSDSKRVRDKVRGFIAVVPEHDLALLAINRRLIDTFEDLPLSNDENKLVASQYVIQAQPPSKLYPYAVEETQIRQTALISDLDSSISKRLEFRDFDPQIRWLGHENRAPMKIGAPLLDDNGDVLAMNTAAFDTTTKQTIALPAKYINDLKKFAVDKILPLPFGGNVAQQNDVPISTPVVAIDADSRSLSENLNRLGEQCQAFSWWAETDDERKAVTSANSLKHSLY